MANILISTFFRISLFVTLSSTVLIHMVETNGSSSSSRIVSTSEAEVQTASEIAIPGDISRIFLGFVDSLPCWGSI